MPDENQNPVEAGDSVFASEGGEANEEVVSTQGAEGAEGAEGTVAEGAKAVDDTTEKVEPQPGLTKDDIERLVKEVAGSAAQTAKTAAEPKTQWTQADFDAAFKVVRPTAEQLDAVREGGEAGVKTLTELLHAAALQAATMSAYQMAQLKEELLAQFNPVAEQVRATAMEQLARRFYAANEDLVGYESLVDEIVNGRLARGTKWETEKAAFDDVAGAARALIQKALGKGSPAAGAAGGSNTRAGSPSRMSTLSSGGRVGTGQASKSRTLDSIPGMEVFD